MRVPLLIVAATLTWPFAGLAAPVTIQGALTVSGNVSVVYLSSDAADVSVVSVVSPSNEVLFRNHGAGATPTGTMISLGALTGPITFELTDLSTGTSFRTGVVDAVDGFFHARYATTYEALAGQALPSVAAASLSGYDANTTVTYVGFEDRRFLDYDYNDLIFAVLSTPIPQPASSKAAAADPADPVSVPEPVSLALLSSGLLGLTVLSRRKTRSA